MRETQAQRGELRDKVEALKLENAELDPKIHALRTTLPGTLHTVQAASFHADKLEKDYQSMETKLNQAIESYTATETSLKALETELAGMRSASRQ